MEESHQRDEGSALPSFLSEDPYPKPSGGRPGSTSSNATSEFDASKRKSDVSGLTGPVGEPGLPPSRPVGNVNTTQAPSWQRGSARGSYTAQPSRRGFTGRGAESSRPKSPPGQTHVPSLAAQGFSRPMSPQKLQAQRGQNITQGGGSRVQSPVPTESLADRQEGDRSNRYSTLSLASVNTERDARRSAEAGAPPLPGSRGLSVTTSAADDYGMPSARSVGSMMSKNSTTPLTTTKNQDPNKLSTINGTPPQMSPRSLRASLGFGSRHSSLRNIHDGRPSKSHEKLHSTPQSPVASFEGKRYSSPTTHSSAKAQGKNYEYFGGNMLFFFSGRLINTRANPVNVATFILMIVPVALFFGFSAPWLWHHISPAMPIVFAYFVFISISAFLHAATSDPGILPRNLHPHPPNPDEDRDPLTVGPATTEWVMVKTFPSHRQKSDAQANAESGLPQTGITTAMEVPTKYCKTCNIWRPPRAHHCRVCDACIETQDHHCVWLNNCVGRRNYRFFFAYVGFSSISTIMLLAFSLVHVGYYGHQHGISFAASLSGRTQERVAFAVFIYSLLALPYPGSLFVYHLFLISRGETTREYLNSHKFKPNERHRPFSQAGPLLNWIAVLVRPRPPSYMSFKRYYAEGDSRLGHTVRRKERMEKAKLEASKRDNRVDGMKKQFSVPRPGKANTVPENGATMEMKQLSPPQREEHDRTSDVPPKKKNTTAPGYANSTPR